MLTQALVNAPRLSLVVVLFLAAGPARAQPSSEPALSAGEAASAREAAHQHFQRGVELAGSGDYEPALAEFSSAYRTFPNFAVLYNVGQAYILLGKPIEAIAALEQYLRDGALQIPAARSERTREQIAAQRTQVAELRVAVNVASAGIEIDGGTVGSSPLVAPLRVNPGTHLLTVRAPDRPPLLRSVTVAPGQVLDLALELPAPPSAQPLAAPVPAPASPASEPELEPQPRSLRTLGWVLGGAGVALGAAALGHYLWNHGRYERWHTEQEALGATRVAGSYEDRQRANNGLSSSIEHAETVTWSLAVSSAACLASSALVFVLDRSGDDTVVASVSPDRANLIVRGTW